MDAHSTVTCCRRRWWWLRLAGSTVVFALATASPTAAQERLCDNSYEDCRAPIIDMIRAENVGLDVSMWFMTDTRYSTEIIRRWQAGVPVRILLDLRADENYPANASVRQSFIDAGIPIRHKTTAGINHWKMILYAGQARVHFSAANFANGSYSPITPYTGYVDEAIYFTDDPAVVHTFMTKYDDLWTNTTHYANLANVGAVTRRYPTYPLDPELNFPPDQDYQDRLVSAMRLETQGIDVVMFRITSSKVVDEMIRRAQAGVPIHLITDRGQYRTPTYFWHSYSIDRMFLAGIPIKWKIDSTDQAVHQKSVVLYGRNMAVFGSSNWTSSSEPQREDNYFTRKTSLVTWFAGQFYRKWNNLRVDGTPISPTMFHDFEPGWPEQPVNISPANGAFGVSTSVSLRWEGGWWAHNYDVHFGTTNPPPLVAEVTRVMICRSAVGPEVAAVDPNCGGTAQIFVGFAAFIDGARPDVAAAFPMSTMNLRAGWGFMLLTNTLPNQGNGTYVFHVWAEDREGRAVPLGSRTMTCSNATATLPFGAIETPTQGGVRLERVSSTSDGR
jgi:PLD-like domain